MEQKEQQLRQELIQLSERLSDPDIFSSKEYPKLARRRTELESVIALFDERSRLQKSKSEAEAMADGDDAELAELAKSELEEVSAKLATNDEALQEALTPKDPNDEKDVIVEIRGAAGGDEANLFAGDLYRMYARWA